MAHYLHLLGLRYLRVIFVAVSVVLRREFQTQEMQLSWQYRQEEVNCAGVLEVEAIKVIWQHGDLCVNLTTRMHKAVSLGSWT